MWIGVMRSVKKPTLSRLKTTLVATGIVAMATLLVFDFFRQHAAGVPGSWFLLIAAIGLLASAVQIIRVTPQSSDSARRTEPVC